MKSRFDFFFLGKLEHENPGHLNKLFKILMGFFTYLVIFLSKKNFDKISRIRNVTKETL